MAYADGFKVVAPKVLIVNKTTPCPVVSGSSVIGMLNISGAKLYVCTTSGGAWELITSA